MGAYTVTRSTDVDAEPAHLHALIDDFHEWVAWSPWEDLDPDLERTYSGPDRGVGAHYAWSGNRKAGRGSMEITSSTPQQIGVALTFQAPFASTTDVTFDLVPSGSGTTVTWTMRGETKGVMALFGRLVPMDKLVGKDFEKGLARLKAVAERAS